MKNRFLPFGLIAVTFGFLLLFLANVMVAGHSGSPVTGDDGNRLSTVRPNQHTGVVDPADVAKALTQANMLGTKSTSGAMNLNWINVGPDNYPGLIWSAIYDNSDPSGLTLIAGAAAGGLWKSTNAGLTWNPMAVANGSVPKVSSIVQTSNGTIYAATGVSSCKNYKFFGEGIYRSVGGQPFELVAGTTGNPDFTIVTKLAINQQSGRIMAATMGGLYYSDNGDTWTKVKSGFTMDVAIGTDGTVLAAVADSAYLSVGGNLNSWVTLTTGAENLLPKTGIGWMTFAIAPSDVNVMYASLVGTDGKMKGIYGSTDKGANWSLIFPSNPSYEPYNGSGCYANTMVVFPNDPYKLFLGGINMWYGQRIQTSGYYNWEQVSYGFYSPWVPFDVPQFHHSYMFKPGGQAQIVIASDGGVSVGTLEEEGLSYQTNNKQLKCAQFNSVSFSAQRHYVMGGGDRIGSLAMGYFYPTLTNSLYDGYPLWLPSALLVGGNGGSCEWSNIESKIAVFSQYKGAPAVRRQDLTDLTYTNTFLNGVDTVSSAYIPMKLWESFNFSQSRDSVKFIARTKTIPADTILMIESLNNKYPFPYHTTAAIQKGDSIMIADPIASRFFMVGNNNATNKGRGIYMTKDMLKFNVDPEFFIIFKDNVTTDPITALAVSGDLNTVWAGTKAGRMIRVTGLINAYDTTTANITNPGCLLVDTIYTNTPFTGRSVTSISILPGNSDKVMVTLGNYGNQDYVYYCQNASAASPVFSSVQSNLPQAPVYSGLLEMHGGNALIGTDVGVYSTNNINAATPSWAPDMTNIGNVPVTDIRQQVMHDYRILNYGVIYLASYGRGVWMDTTYYTPVGIEPIAGNNNAQGAIKITPNPASDIVSVTYMNISSGVLSADVLDLNGRVVKSVTFGTRPKGLFTGEINISDLSTGQYIIRMGNAVAKLIKL